jgi:hypothetical protein
MPAGLAGVDGNGGSGTLGNGGVGTGGKGAGAISPLGRLVGVAITGGGVEAGGNGAGDCVTPMFRRGNVNVSVGVNVALPLSAGCSCGRAAPAPGTITGDVAFGSGTFDGIVGFTIGFGSFDIGGGGGSLFKSAALGRFDWGCHDSSGGSGISAGCSRSLIAAFVAAK